MGRRIVANGRNLKTIDAERGAKVFDGKRPAKLGTKKNPAVVKVRTEARFKEVASIFEEKGWEYKIQLEADLEEDISDLERLLNPPKPAAAEKKVQRNEPCPCKSGKKYKSCCGK
jgi:SWIM/SEC-C metal-binding protein